MLNSQIHMFRSVHFYMLHTQMTSIQIKVFLASLFSSKEITPFLN